MNDLYIKSCRNERIDLAFDKCAQMWFLFCRVVSCHHQNTKWSAGYLLFRVCKSHSSYSSFLTKWQPGCLEQPIFLLPHIGFSLSTSDYLLAVSAQAAQDERMAYPCRPGTI